MEEDRKLRTADVLWPVLFVLVLWVVELVEWEMDATFAQYGLLPRSIEGLAGIVTAPFIHDDWEHLINNSVPLIVLGIGICYFYRPVAFRIYLGSILITGIWVWVAARKSYHIGASGMVYSFASFVFFSGFIRKYYRLIALSLLVVFLYGSMVWGIFPLQYKISWESHMMGALAGLVMAYFFRQHGPTPKEYEWEEEDDDDDDFPGDSSQQNTPGSVNVVYHYRQSSENKDDKQ